MTGGSVMNSYLEGENISLDDLYLEVENKSFEDLYLKFCGMEKCAPNYSYGPAVRSFPLIHYCLEGQGKFYFNDKVYPIKKGDAFLIMPDVVTFYQADSEDPWRYLWISFPETRPNSILADAISTKRIQLSTATTEMSWWRQPRLLSSTTN